jgi:hypothetical protein
MLSNKLMIKWLVPLKTFLPLDLDSLFDLFVLFEIVLIMCCDEN